MANQSGRPIAPARKLVAAVLGTLAVFVMVFGLGLSSWAIVVLGLAVLALSIALGMVNVVRRGARAWVSGTAQVKAVSDAPVSSAYGRAELQLVVVAPGLPVTEVLVRDPRVPVDKWPRLGETLPVTVDVDDMRRVRIDWLNAPDHTDPPPPMASYPADSYPDAVDDYDDDLLGEPEPPPWAAPERQWGVGPDEPPPPPPPGVAAGGDRQDSPVVVRDTPEGPVVEGHLVDLDKPPPLPRRPRSGPIPSPSPPADAPAAGSPPPADTPAAESAATDEPAADTPAGSAPPVDTPAAESAPATDEPAAAAAQADSGPAEPRASRSRPSPRPRTADAPAAAATATVDAETRRPFDGTEAPPRPAAPEQRSAPESGDAHGPRATAAPGAVDPDLDEPAPAARQSAEAPATEPTHDPDIDLPLDGDPEPPPERTNPAAREAVAGGLLATPVDDIGPADERTPPNDSTRPETAPPDEPIPPAGAVRYTSSDDPASAAPADESPAAPGETAAEPPDTVPEVEPSDRPVISGVDAPPSDAAATAAAAAGAVAGASATHTANGRAHPGSEEHGGPWADLEGGYEPDDRADEVITAYPSARPGPAGAIHGVGITVLVTNLERSVGFYRDILGFFEIDRGRGSAVLASGDTRLVLRTVHDLTAESGRLIYLNLEVGDVEAVYQELKAKGVTFVHAPRAVNRGDKLELWSATFTDPDRHNIAISQWRAI